MQITRALRSAALNTSSIYKVLVTGLLIYELVKFRFFGKFPKNGT